MKSKNIKKINDLGKVGKILSIILLVLTTISLVMCVILAVAMTTLPDDFMEVNGKWICNTVTDYTSPMIGANEPVENYTSEVDLSGLKIKTVSHDKQDSNNKNIISTDTETTIEGNAGRPIKTIAIIVAVFCAIMLLLLAIALRFAKAFCKALEKCDSPFEENVVKKMSNFAISLIPWGVFCVGAGGMSAVGIAFIVIIVCLFSAIFRHGAELQKESDELL